MGKKKGRQSGSFASKSMRAAYVAEVKSHAQEVPRRQFSSSGIQRSSAVVQSKATAAGDARRPKLLLSRLRGMLQERQLHDRLSDRMARRRRHSLLSAMIQDIGNSSANSEIMASCGSEEMHLKRNPPGWILHYNRRDTLSCLRNDETAIPSLQSQCIRVLGPAMVEYYDALGRESLRAIMGMFPSTTLEALSVHISSTVGMTDDLAHVIGKHDHLEKLCLHNHPDTLVTQYEDAEDGVNDFAERFDYVSDKGIVDLMPRLVSCIMNDSQIETQFSTVLDSWEQVEDADDMVEMEGCIRLKRFELVNAYAVSALTLSSFLWKCSCITHLSLSGSLSWNAGHDVLLQLDLLLPNLQVLDLSFCSWVTEALLRSFWGRYHQQELHHRTDRAPSGVPVVCAVGCASLSVSAREDLLYDFPGSLITPFSDENSPSTHMCLSEIPSSLPL